jgi:hypothetical protein
VGWGFAGWLARCLVFLSTAQHQLEWRLQLCAAEHLPHGMTAKPSFTFVMIWQLPMSKWRKTSQLLTNAEI